MVYAMTCTVGRIAVLDNQNYNEHSGAAPPSSSFLTLTTTLRPRCDLWARIETWAKARGLTKIVGAKGFLQGDGVGVSGRRLRASPGGRNPIQLCVLRRADRTRRLLRQRDFMSAYLPGNVELPPRDPRDRREDEGAPRGLPSGPSPPSPSCVNWVPADRTDLQ